MKTDNPAGRTPAKPLNEEALQRMLQARTRLAAETRLHKELGEQYRCYMRLAVLRHYAASCCAIGARRTLGRDSRGTRRRHQPLLT